MIDCTSTWEFQFFLVASILVFKAFDGNFVELLGLTAGLQKARCTIDNLNALLKS